MNPLQSSSPQPSALRVLLTDLPSTVMTALLIIIWVAFIILASQGRLPGKDGDLLTYAPFHVYVVTGFTAVALPLLLWRVHSTRQLFAHGVEVPGTITALSFHRGDGYIRYTYAYLGVTYSGFNVIIQTGRTDKIRPGDQVTVMLRRENPKHAAVRELYLSGPTTPNITTHV